VIKTFISRPIFTAMLVLAVVVFGVFSYPKIGVDQFPEVDFPVVTVTVVLPGADPEIIERNVAKPLEEALNTLGGLDTLRSVNVENVAQLILRFKLEKDVDVAAQEVRDRVQATLRQLPAEIDPPVVEKFDIGAAPIVTLAVSGPLPGRALTHLADDVIKPALQRIEGVGAVEIVGGTKREIQVVVDPTRARAFGLGVDEIIEAVRLQSVDVPGGRMHEPGRERTVKLQAEAKRVDELRDLVVASPRGTPIRLRDVAELIDGPAEARSSAHFGQQRSIGLVVRKQSGANTVQVVERVTESLRELTGLLPDGCRVDLVTDGAKFIRGSIHAVQEDMLFGAALAVGIVLIFLRNGRSTLISAVALPTSVVGTFAAMHALGFTFNIITMLALTLSIGLLIDDAIVVIENIVRHLEHGESPIDAALLGTREIVLAVLAVTLAIVAVFVPVAFMEGLIGRFFYQFGVTVAVAVMISYAVSMTLTPMLSARLLREHEGEPGRLSRAIERVLVATESTYRTLLGILLRHRVWTMVGAVGVLALTLFMARYLKTTFMPSQDMGMAKVTVELPIGTPLEGTERELASLASQIAAVPGVESVYTSAGGGVQEEVHRGEIVVNLVPIGRRRFSQTDFKQYLRDELRQGPGEKITVQDFSPVSGGGNRPQQVQFNLRSDDWDALLAAVEKTRVAMLANPGFVDVDTTYRGGKPQLDVKVDRERAANVGVPAAVLGRTLRGFLGGDKIATFRDASDSYDVKVKLPPIVQADPAQLGRITVRGASGQLVELRAIAEIVPGAGPSQIERQSQKRQVTLLADLRGYSLGEATKFLNEFADKNLPKSVIHDFEGNAKEMGKAAVAFLVALLLGTVLVYIILAAQFESLLHPFVIMTSLPFSLIGVIGGLLAAREYMSMFAMIGVIMLFGLVLKNGILLVEFTNQVRERGKSVNDALLEAGPVRLRPILMTTIAMIAGMVPVALARGDGAETRVPMAVAIIGGLVSSTVLTLGVVPVVYSLVESVRRRVSAWLGVPVAVEETELAA
jgi:HAE1 family hydrophobic/amphiphilic exporter-1